MPIWNEKGTVFEARVSVGVDVCSCGCVGVCGQHRFLQYFTLLYWFIYWFPHRLVSSLPMCLVKQYHLFIRLHHSNQYVGLGSVCVLHVCKGVGGGDGCMCTNVYVCVCVCVNLEENAQTPKSVCEV